ncbi:MAG: TetR/AcrR family transcriptional regulator [Odoribacteraceae bacterium]|jgi:AcrR family transcriptional regulator|nr:TetR/AcrR family transcriptional regulator [Odoribacteraceae bacterium]
MDTTTEQSIMLAAEVEFMEKGFVAAKTTDIARRAGVTHAMLHYYYRTKENLFKQVFQKKIQLLADSFVTILSQEIPFLEKIQQGVSAHLDFLAANPRLPLFVLWEIVGNPDRQETCREVLLPVFKKVIEELQEILDAERRRGASVPESAQELMLNIVSMNVFTILSLPIAMLLTETREEDRDQFLQRRKQQIVRQVLSQLTENHK